jgi:hypothetical protein
MNKYHIFTNAGDFIILCDVFTFDDNSIQLIKDHEVIFYLAREHFILIRRLDD